jgi:sugar/nucleoside kinase (ribokinase family)
MGCAVQDIVVKLDEPLMTGGSTVSRISFSAGGFGPNVAWTAALEGAAVRFVGQAGADLVGDALLKAMSGAGIEVGTSVVRKGTTCCILVLVDGDGQRTMAYDTASFSLGADEVTEGALAGAGVLHLYSNMFDDITAEGAWRAVELVRREGGLVSLDVGNIACVHRDGREKYVEMVERIAPEVLFANEDETAALWPSGEVRAPGLVIAKNGAGPTVVYGPDGSEILEVPVTPVPDVMDTTGAGDAMAGGFLAAWTAGLSVRGAVEAGHRTAAAVIRQFGAQLPATWAAGRPPGRT